MALCCHKCIRQNGRSGGFRLQVMSTSVSKRRPKRRLFFRLCGLDAPPYFFWSASADTLSRQTGIRI